MTRQLGSMETERETDGDSTSAFLKSLSMLARRRGRLSPATAAGLRQKELLKSRKTRRS